MASATRWEDNDRRRHRRDDDDDDRRGGARRYEDDARDMRRSYGGYSGARGGYERDDEREHDRDRGFGIEGEYGAERYRPYAEDRGRQGGYGEERYGGNYGNPSRYGDRSQHGGQRDEGTGLGRYGQGQISMGNDNQWERRAYGSQQESGPHRGSGPKGYKRPDERIREDVCDCLTDAAHLDASEIEVTVKDGEVTMSGTVDSREHKRMAEDMAERISGVKHVQNNLRIEQKASAMNAMSMGKNQSAQKRH